MASAVPAIPAAARFEAVRPVDWSQFATGVLDLLRDAVLVVGRDARLLGMNRAAHVLLREGDGLLLSARGVVASSPAATLPLLRSVERAARGEVAKLRVPRVGRAPLVLRIEPHPGAAGVAAVAVVFASDPEAHGLGGAALGERYGLTRTEAVVARRLAAGTDLEHIAGELRISLNTVRGHLKQIFAKTCTHRQAELVSTLLAGD
jgi:DNA-binding CsgD family transcriptional regulator